MSVPSGSILSPSLHVQSGNTPLLRAAQEGHAEVARFLLGNGSSVKEQDNVGWPKGILHSCDHLMLFPRELPCTGYILCLQMCHSQMFCNKPWLSKYFVLHSTYTSSVSCVTIHYCTLPSGWLDFHSACCSIWPWGPSARVVWYLWGRLPAQEEGEGYADCTWQ